MPDSITPNPDLYAKMAEPYPSKEEADSAIERFADDVRAIREKHRVPELLMVTAAHFLYGERRMVDVAVLALGNAEYRAELAAIAYGQYTVPEL